MRKYVQNEDMKYIKKIDDWQGGIISINMDTFILDIEWRPIVTQFGTLIENMSRTRLYDGHSF